MKAKGGRPKGSTDLLPRTRRNLEDVSEKINGLRYLRKKANVVAEELVRIALHAREEQVRAAACRDVLSYAWGKPVPIEGPGEDGTKVTIVNVITGVRG